MDKRYGTLRRYGWILASLFSWRLVQVLFGLGVLVLGSSWLIDASKTDEPGAFIMLCVLAPSGAMSAAIGFGLWSWFRGPARRLTPYFMLSHTLVAVGLVILVVVLATWRLVASDNDLLVSVVVVLAVASPIFCSFSGNPEHARGIPLWLAVGKVIVMFTFLMLLVPLLLMLPHPSYGSAILNGEMPGLVAVLASMSAVSIGLTIISLRGLVAAPTGNELAVFTSARGRTSCQSTPGWAFASADRENQIEHWAEGTTQWNWWNRVQRWRAGNPMFFRTFPRLIVMLIMNAVYLWGMHLAINTFIAPGGWDVENFRGTIIAFALAMCWLDAIRVAFIWRSRMQTLSLEFLRPYDRRALQNELAAGLVADLIPLTVLIAAIDSVAVNLSSDWNVVWHRVPGDFAVLVVSVMTIAAATAALIVVIRRNWLALLAVACVMVLAVAPVGLSPLLENSSALRSTLLLLWVPAALCVPLCYVLHRRWMTLEIGSRA